MIKQTHRAFAVASATGIIALNNYIYDHTDMIVTNSAPLTEIRHSLLRPYTITDMLIVIGAAWITATWPDIDIYLKKHNINIIGHRTITHTIWVVLLILFLCVMTSQIQELHMMAIGLLIGYTSHIVGDSFSTQGVAWTYPLRKYKKYPSGATILTGNRYIFKPLYKVGKQTTKYKASTYYYIIAILAICFITKE